MKFNGCIPMNAFFQSPVKIKLINVSFQRADLVVADLTITYDREQAVDFTMPFMNLGKCSDSTKIKITERMRKLIFFF